MKIVSVGHVAGMTGKMNSNRFGMKGVALITWAYIGEISGILNQLSGREYVLDSSGLVSEPLAVCGEQGNEQCFHRMLGISLG